MDENKVKFKAKFRQDGGSKVFSTPQALLDFLEVDLGDEIILVGDKGKYGKFIAFWKTPKE